MTIQESQESKESRASIPQFVPEVLAPVGGREQFFAALNSGADAVFLGLKNFNARARAENFSLDDLRELVPLAQAHGVNVLVTMNILIKSTELKSLLETLSALEEIGVHAIIVQDLGLARLCREFFPNLRLHASTQMAVHNLDGVLEAVRAGFKRVVLARELTAIEIKKIRAAVPREVVELEAFCHGSLCYSYSGLCFFSGAEDARSGNRGECAYTCRKPYKIINEPGHGFLFSMKDLNTVESLHLLVEAGVDTLKIEGRKKDAQYVSTVVQSYRQKLNEIFGRSTLKPEAPALAHALTQTNSHLPQKISEKMSLSFQRESTSFFLKGRYHENVIDLNNPTHKGQTVGHVIQLRGRLIELVAQCALERFDGLRIDPHSEIYHSTPQHGSATKTTTQGVSKKYDNEVCHFSLRQMFHNGKSVTSVAAGSTVAIEIPEHLPLPTVGDVVVRTRSDELRREVEKISRPGPETRLRALKNVDVIVNITHEGEEIKIKTSASKFSFPIATSSISVKALRPEKGASTLARDIADLMQIFGNINFSSSNLSVQGDTQWFVPRGQLKELKRKFEEILPQGYEDFLRNRLGVALEGLSSQRDSLRTTSDTAPRFSLKIDRLEYLEWINEYLNTNSEAKIKIDEVVFEPKRAFLPHHSFDEAAEQLQSFSKSSGLALRLAFPTVLRAWDEPMMKKWTQTFISHGITAVEIGNLGVLHMLERWAVRDQVTSISSDFTLYALNSSAAGYWRDRGVSQLALSVEDDFENMSSTLQSWPKGVSPQVILFKDTPLFIAESCSLTALHNGCPSNTVCGYRTLEIENERGERFFVAHESCKSIVYDNRAYSITHRREQLERIGIQSFRLDFLTRPYGRERFLEILEAAQSGAIVPTTHTANFERTLL